MKAFTAVLALTSAMLAAAVPTPPVWTVTPPPDDFGSTAVYQHNIHRANHTAALASYNADLASYAATTANTCVFAHSSVPGGGGYGQNIAEYSTSAPLHAANADVMLAWAITDEWYNHELPSFPTSGYGESTPDLTHFSSWGHFSQVVWNASTEIGCAAQICPAGTISASLNSWFIVCNYRAQGNVSPNYGKNIFPPRGAPTVTIAVSP